MKRRDFNKNVTLMGSLALLPSFIGLKNVKDEFKVTVGNTEVFSNGGSHKVRTNPVFVIAHEGKSEVLVFESDLKYQTLKPKKNSMGFRTVDIDVQGWEGTTYSKLLQKNVSFRVADSHQSKITSEYLNQDFPSKLLLNIEYDVLIDGEVIKRGISGRVSTTLNSIVPDVKNILKVEGNNVKIGKRNNLDIIFCNA